MRSFSSGFQSKLAGSSYLPVLFCKYELVTYVSGATPGTGSQTTTPFYWAERAITYDSQAYESRLVNTSPLEQSLEADGQSFGSMGLQISNFPSNVAGVIQAGMKCTVYLGFEDSVGSGTVTDAEVMFIGTVEGDIEITEDSVSFNLQDIAHAYDKQLPALISRKEFPFADPDAIGDTMPIVMGRVQDHVCRPVASGFASVIAQDSEGWDYYVQTIGWTEAEAKQYVTNTFGNHIYVTDDIGWWRDAYDVFQDGNPLYTDDILLNTGYDQNNSVAVDWDETLTIDSISWDTTEQLWKITFTEPPKYRHYRGNTTIIQDYCGTVSEGYAYLVADHPVEDIRNVKVDGLPTTQFYAYPNYQGDPSVCFDWELPHGKAYIVVAKNPGTRSVSGAGGLQISDTTDVDDSILVDDTVDVNELGHEHSIGGSGVYQFDLEINWKYGRAGGDANSRVLIMIKTVGIEIIVLDTDLQTLTRGPYSFTSTSDNVRVYYGAYGKNSSGSAYFSYLNVKAKRTDDTGAVSYATVSRTYYTGSDASPLDFGPPVLATPTSKEFAGVSKTGAAVKLGEAKKVGAVELISGNSAADVLIGNQVTCDVIGICDGSTGLVYPHQQIKKLINTYVRNPVSGTEGNANVVEFANESEADTYFDKVYNTSSTSNSALSHYPVLNDWHGGTENPSPDYQLYPAMDAVEGIHALDFAISEPNRLRDIIGDMLYQGNCVIHWRNGVAQIRFVPDSPTQDDLIDDSDIVMRSMSLARSKASDLATDIAVRYDYNTVKDYQRKYDYAEEIGRGQFYMRNPLDATRTVGTYTRERTYDLTMIRDQIGAEIVAKRLYDTYSAPKFSSSIATTLKNLAIEPTDFVTVNTPIYANGVLDKGIVKRKTLEFGSAIDRNPDLVHLTVEQSHVENGFYITTGDLSDSVGVSDSTPTLTLNDVNTLFATLSDSVSVGDTIFVNPFRTLSDSVGVSEAVAFDFEVSLSDTISIDDSVLKFTGILFWGLTLDDTVSISDVASVQLRDSVYEDGVFVKTDLTTVGVFE